MLFAEAIIGPIQRPEFTERDRPKPAAHHGPLWEARYTLRMTVFGLTPALLHQECYQLG